MLNESKYRNPNHNEIAHRLYPDPNKLERVIYSSLHNPNCLNGKHDYAKQRISEVPLHTKYTCRNCDHSFELRPEFYEQELPAYIKYRKRLL